MMNIPDPMPLQPACGGPLSSPDTFFDLRIVFLPVSGKSSSSLLSGKISFSLLWYNIFFLAGKR